MAEGRCRQEDGDQGRGACCVPLAEFLPLSGPLTLHPSTPQQKRQWVVTMAWKVVLS